MHPSVAALFQSAAAAGGGNAAPVLSHPQSLPHPLPQQQQPYPPAAMYSHQQRSPPPQSLHMPPFPFSPHPPPSAASHHAGPPPPPFAHPVSFAAHTSAAPTVGFAAAPHPPLPLQQHTTLPSAIPFQPHHPPPLQMQPQQPPPPLTMMHPHQQQQQQPHLSVMGQQRPPAPLPHPSFALQPHQPPPFAQHPTAVAAAAATAADTSVAKGIGASLSETTEEAEEVVPVNGLPLSRHHTLALRDFQSLLSGETASAPCTEFSAIPRDLPSDDAPIAEGVWIVHQQGVTLFALKQGLVRLVYQPQTQQSEDAAATNKHMEVLRGHSAQVIDMCFISLPRDEDTRARLKIDASQQVLLALTLSRAELLLWRFDLTATASSEGAVPIKVTNVAKISRAGFIRMRCNNSDNNLRGRVALLDEDGRVHTLSVSDVIATSGAPADAIKSCNIGDEHGRVSDVCWQHDRVLFATERGVVFTMKSGDIAADAQGSVGAEVQRIISVPTTQTLSVAASAAFSTLTLLNGELQSIASLQLQVPDSIILGSMDVDPAGRFVVLPFRKRERSGENTDQGALFIHINRDDEAAARFDFLSVVLQPSPILSFSVAAAENASAAASGNTGSDFLIFACELKPVVKLLIQVKMIYRADLAAAATVADPTSAADGESAAAPSSSVLPARVDSRAGELVAGEDHSPVSDGASRQEVAAPSDSQEDLSPSPLADSAFLPAASSSSCGLQSPTSSAGTAARERAELTRHDSTQFEELPSLDTSAAAEYNSGRSSPNVNSQAMSPRHQPQQLQLRPRHTHQQSHGRLPSSTATPSVTPALPSTPHTSAAAGVPASSTLNKILNYRAASVSSRRGEDTGSESSSPFISPAPSPRNQRTQQSTPPSPGVPAMQQQQSVATTAEPSTAVSHAASPVVTSLPSSPLVTSSPTPSQMQMSGIQTIPNTPIASGAGIAVSSNSNRSSTGTPAPTPINQPPSTMREPSVLNLERLSTPEVAVHFLSASSSGSSLGSLSTATPFPTPAVSVANTPRHSGRVRAISQTSTNGSLRVRTHSNNSSPAFSPIASPHTLGSHKSRSSSLEFDRAPLDPLIREDESEESRAEEENRINSSVEGASTSTSTASTPSQPQHAATTGTAATTSPSTSLPPPLVPSEVMPRNDAKARQEQSLMLRLDQLFARHFGRLSVLCSQERNEMQQQERMRVEGIAADLKQQIASICEQAMEQPLRTIDASMKDVCEAALFPAIERSINRAVEQLKSSSSAAVTSAAPKLTEAVLSGLRAALSESFRTAFLNTLLPSFEQMTRQMMAQIVSSVSSATTSSNTEVNALRKFIEQNERDAKKRAEESEKQRLAQLADIQRREKAAAEQLSAMQQALTTMATSQAKLVATVESLRSELEAQRKAALSASSAAAVTAAASPPTPVTPSSADTRVEVSRLLSNHQYEAAFTRALSSGSVQAVMFCCSQVDPRQLFSTHLGHPPLSSPVLLSLLQQLSVTLSADDSHLKLKLLWLRECAVALPVHDPLIQAHVRGILGELVRKLDLVTAVKDTTHECYDQARVVRQLVIAKMPMA